MDLTEEQTQELLCSRVRAVAFAALDAGVSQEKLQAAVQAAIAGHALQVQARAETRRRKLRVV